MQQTETYQLNLIETSDTFSPDPLNQNTRKIEEALSAETSQRTAADTVLDHRIATLEGHKFVVGSYTGSSSTHGVFQAINLGFKPQLVYVYCSRLGYGLATQAYPYHVDGIVITENGFKVSCNSTSSMNCYQDLFVYFAIK